MNYAHELTHVSLLASGISMNWCRYELVSTVGVNSCLLH